MERVPSNRGYIGRPPLRFTSISTAKIVQVDEARKHPAPGPGIPRVGAAGEPPLGGHARRAPLLALARVGHRLLGRGFGDCHPLQADGEARVVHHGEHARHAARVCRPADERGSSTHLGRPSRHTAHVARWRYAPPSGDQVGIDKVRRSLRPAVRPWSSLRLAELPTIRPSTIANV